LVLDFQKKTIKIDDLKINANIQFIIYSVGVIAIRIRIPMENFDRSKVERLTFDKKIEETFKRLSEETKADIQKRLSKYIKIKDRSIFEMYRVYFIQGDASEFILENKKWIAGILLDEQNYENLSNDYVDNTIKRKLSYYNDDLIITDWDAAFIISRIDKYENEMTVIDTSNVQLLEYRVYQDEIDRMIDNINIRILNLQRKPWNILFSRRNMIKLSTEISDFYTEYKDMIDSVNNIIMSFGDWYLARLYSMLSDSFKLKDLELHLENTFDMLIKIRDFIDERIAEDTNSFLEIIVIVLFIAEIVIMLLFKL